MMTNKDYKCPSCGTSDFKMENGYYVCQICGHQEKMPPKPDEKQIKKEKIARLEKKLLEYLDKLCKLGIVLGVIGVVMFLAIIFIGLAIYGRVYLFDGYGSTKVLSIISIVFMQIGFWSFIIRIGVKKERERH